MWRQLPRPSSERCSRSELPKAQNCQLGSGNRRKVNLPPRPGKTNPRRRLSTDLGYPGRTHHNPGPRTRAPEKRSSLTWPRAFLLTRFPCLIVKSRFHPYSLIVLCRKTKPRKNPPPPAPVPMTNATPPSASKPSGSNAGKAIPSSTQPTQPTPLRRNTTSSKCCHIPPVCCTWDL